jgi:hypothetical protein
MQYSNVLGKCKTTALLLLLVCVISSPLLAQRSGGHKRRNISPTIPSSRLERGRSWQRSSLQQRFERAVRDAEIAEPREISKNLMAIVESNERLRWEGIKGKSRLLVVTWTNWGGYAKNINHSMPLERDVWVTVVPELKEFCHHVRHRRYLSLRLRQLLGLPPTDSKNQFVELWVDPNDLFRPSPDPEINDHEASLDFPRSGFLKIDEAYVKWFNDLRSKSYGASGYPWTRLGYTYDWGNPKSEIGLSEFVIKQGAVVIVSSALDTASYCR